MNRFYLPLLTLCLLLSLPACGSTLEGGDTPAPEMPAAPSQPLGGDLDEELPYGVPVDFDPSGLPEAFAAAIGDYCRTGVFPDGGEPREIPGRFSYAVLDIDGDGREELILQNTAAAMAGQVEKVYGYDGSAFLEELSAFPALTYYDNGIIRADWSHNQGWAGEFWPYTLYCYQDETDTYENAGSVDAWDETLHPTGFPRGTDTDGDGMVYFLLTDNWGFAAYLEPASGEKYYTYDQLPVDGAEYLAWKDSLLQDASPMEIPYREVAVEVVFPNAAG
ncbi:MAG: hypothetical protein HFG08_00735 [Oscillibacter sp.]|nr:hypothetical protein [Oscillibacter sp.]